MTPDRWKRLEEIYHAARTRDSAERAAYVAEACGDDDDLRLQIESLLIHGEALSKLESKVVPGATPAPLTAGAMIGPYRIKERLDAGGMGVVYRALDTRLGREVAIKIGLAQFSDRFHREARMVAALNHSNICTLHDIGSTPETPGYLVMEFVEGPTLARKLESGAMPVAEALQIARQIAAALAAAHAHGIVHRDLKPANVKIGPQGVVKVLDFGLAKDFPGARPDSRETHAERSTELLTAAGTILGTAAYMSPEQAAGKETNAQSDIFSFGIVLYEMLCGRRPFNGTTSTEVMADILKAQPEPPHRLRAGISEPLERIVLKCLQRNLESRYATGAELQQDLEKLVKVPETGRFLAVRAALLTAAVLIAVIGSYYGWQSYRHRSDLRWLEQTAVPEITNLLQHDRALEALRIYRKAERIAPDPKLLYKFAEGVAARPIKFVTTPPGAKVYVSDYRAAAGDNLSEWQFVGQAPVTLSEIPNWGYYRVRVIKDGFVPADQVFGPTREVNVTLHPNGTVPQGMVWVPPTPTTEIQPSISLPGFWMDRYEVTNRQFKEFVDAGGYRKPEYWKEPFLKEGHPLWWEQAMLEFHDLTGRPGPANWSLGAYPEGTADLPAAGVSWYEAMAYAEFAGKALPTVYEWRHAALVADDLNSDVALMSNFSGKALAPVGAYHGMTAFGSYDMAGNVKEWTVNRIETRRYAMGGAWDEPMYAFSQVDALDPFSRTISLGLRCVRRPEPAPAASYAPLDLRPPQVGGSQPVDDKTYRIYAAYHQYQPTALESRVDRTDNSSPYSTSETVSFRAAYANDRVIAHLFLPKSAVPPYQVVIAFGGADIMSAKHMEEMQYGYPYEFLIRSGRAVMIPAYWGTLERGPSEWFLPPQEERERSLKWSWDLSRSVDYLQARRDIDGTKLGFYAISWGAQHAARLLAVDTRFKAAALVSGGLQFAQPPEVDSWNFAPRYHVPTLMLNGKQDFIFPYETNQKLLFHALGTPEGDKKLLLFEGGHRNPETRPELVSEIIGWFDHYLGSVKER
jgi:formylglycine-generating enzyme required for sulfatase activity